MIIDTIHLNYWGIQLRIKSSILTQIIVVVSLFTHKNPSSKLSRIRVDLPDYDFTIVHEKGNMNTNADALSRIELGFDSLNGMIPPEIDDNTKRKLLAITRGMAKKQAYPHKNRFWSTILFGLHKFVWHHRWNKIKIYPKRWKYKWKYKYRTYK